MKHAVIYSVPPFVRERIRQQAMEVGDDKWTIHDEMVIEFPDDRDISEVIDPILDDIEQAPVDVGESGRPVFSNISIEDYMTFSSLVLSPRRVVEYPAQYERPENRDDATLPLEDDEVTDRRD